MYGCMYVGMYVCIYVSCMQMYRHICMYVFKLGLDLIRDTEATRSRNLQSKPMDSHALSQESESESRNLQSVRD